jgi:hypothetical protein
MGPYTHCPVDKATKTWYDWFVGRRDERIARLDERTNDMWITITRHLSSDMCEVKVPGIPEPRFFTSRASAEAYAEVRSLVMNLPVDRINK